MIESLESRIAPAGLIKTGMGTMSSSLVWFYSGGSISLGGETSLPVPLYTPIGDVNGDGLGDQLVTGQWRELVSGNGGAIYQTWDQNASWVVLGGSRVISPAQLDGTNGFKIKFDASGTRSVQAVGDLNDDGYDDLVVQTKLDYSISTSYNSAYVIFGQATAFSAVRDVGGAVSYFPGDNNTVVKTAIPDLDHNGVEESLFAYPQIDPGGGGISHVTYLVYGQGNAELQISKNGRKATYHDQRIGHVTVTVSKGSLSPENFTFRDGSLQTLNLADDGQEFAGANITFSPFNPHRPDWPFRVGSIDARGIDLGIVTMPGDLGQIDAGDTNAVTPAVKQLRVYSLGAFGEEAAALGRLHAVTSDLFGGLGKLIAKGDVEGVISITGGSVAKLGAAIIGGNLDGRAGGAEAGLLRAEGSIGSVKIRGSVLGGAQSSGIIAGGKLGTVSIAQDLTSDSSATPVTISAFGTYLPTTQKATLAIASVYVQGDVSHARVLAGTTIGLLASNPDASMGTLIVGGDWTDSSVAAGLVDTSVAPGDPQQSVIRLGGQPALGGGTDPVSAINRVVIKGFANPSALGLIAERIGKVTVHGKNYLVIAPGTP